MYDVAPCEVNILISDDACLRQLNRDFRHLDEATDVLTFPAGDNAFGLLGDVAISYETAQRQADARNDVLANELHYLALHGALHLLGYDDVTDAGRDDMVRRMNEVAIAAGLPGDGEWSSLPHGDAS
jgi:rRNA maturation RNase YbeY